MPSTVYEREEVSPLMQKALRVYILREKEKRQKEAAEKEKDVERRVREEEEKRKKKEEELSTIEEIKDQLLELNKKLEDLRQEKHQLFHRFKRLLNDENMKKAQKHQRECDVQVQAGNMLSNRYHPSSAINVQALSYLQHSQQSYFFHSASPMGQAVMSPGRPAMHYNHHMSPSPSNQGRKLSDQHSADESIAGHIRSAIHQSSKSPQLYFTLPITLSTGSFPVRVIQRRNGEGLGNQCQGSGDWTKSSGGLGPTGLRPGHSKGVRKSNTGHWGETQLSDLHGCMLPALSTI